VRRREFIGLLGAAAAWPVVARAQQTERMPRIAVLQGARDDPRDPRSQPNTAAFLEALQQLGWTDGRRPGGNVTGFSLFEYGLSTKWLESRSRQA
jgi:putative tryptophan/tyrosine transport system substrate-binding protein